MKKILTLALSLVGVQLAMAAGSLQFQNSTVSTPFYTNNPSGPPGKVSNTPGTMSYGLFVSDVTLGGVSNNLSFVIAVGNLTSGGGGLIDGFNNLLIPGTSSGDQAWIMVLAWDGALGLGGYTNYVGAYGSGPAGAASTQWNGAGQWFLQTRTILVTLGAEPFPGSVMFQNPSDANHIGGISDQTIFAVPEPSSLAVLISGVAATYLFRRKKSSMR